MRSRTWTRNSHRNLLELQEVLYELRSGARSGRRPWNRLGHLEKHYLQACQKLYLPNDLYQFELEKENGKPKFVFRKDYYRIGKYIERFGKNIIVTDHSDWSTDEIVRASLDRCLVEEAFRQSKGDELASVMPMRHWTDGKIRCFEAKLGKIFVKALYCFLNIQKCLS
jgi:transposase